MRPALLELAALFLRLGATAFGGPAAHIAMMRDEVVVRRRWLSDARFLDLLAATNLLPGPNSTEMAIHVGYRRGGLAGSIVAGVAFILPAFVCVLALAWAYVRFGQLPEVRWLLYGVSPVVIVILIDAIWRLGRTAIRNSFLAVIAVGAAALSWRGTNELLLLAGAALFSIGVRIGIKSQLLAGVLLGMVTVHAQALAGAGASSFSLGQLSLFFLKVGSILFGSGYVLVAYLRADLVERWGWLTDAQLVDAVAVGQFTPGPVLTTATFIGYVLGGWAGGALATLAIFTPAFVFVALSQPLLQRLRTWPLVAAALDGVVAASLGLMAAVAVRLGGAAIPDLPAAAIALVALVGALALRINATWLVIGGAAAGWLFKGL